MYFTLPSSLFALLLKVVLFYLPFHNLIEQLKNTITMKTRWHRPQKSGNLFGLISFYNIFLAHALENDPFEIFKKFPEKRPWRNSCSSVMCLIAGLRKPWSLLQNIHENVSVPPLEIARKRMVFFWFQG